MKKAVLICDDHYNGLGVARSLGLKKIPVICILTTDKECEKALLSFSKYIEKIFYVNHNDDEIKKTMDIIAYENPCCDLFVYPLSDFASIFCDNHYSILPKNYIVPNANGNIRQFQNKITIASALKEFGVNVPKHLEIDLSSKCFDWNCYPSIIKPVLSIEGNKSDIIIVQNESELKNAINTFRHVNYSRVMIEEYINGTNEYMIEILGAARNDKIIFTPPIRKIREYPIKNGSTSFATIEAERNDCYLTEIDSFLRNIKYQGLFDIEYKYADGKVYFIELNFRNGAPSYIFTKRNANLAYWWCSSDNDINYKNSGKRFMVEQRDFLHVHKKNISLFKWFFQYISSTHVFWMWRDCSPCIHYYKRLLKRKRKHEK